MATFTGTSAANRINGTSASDIIRGLAGNDTLYGNGGDDVIDGGAGNDRIYGGAGNDRIYGGSGTDTLTGGTGSDTFVYKAASDSRGIYTGDFITDWDPIDRIDLSAIDANESVYGNQAFRFAGYSFGEPPSITTAGTLTIAGFGGELYVIGHTNNDGVPDLVIALWSALGEGGLTVGDLIL